MRAPILLCLLFLVSAGCGLPQGAALQSRLIRSAEAPEADVQTIPVTRALAQRYSAVPAGTGLAGRAWPGASAGASTARIRTGDRIDVTIWDSQENSLLTGVSQKFVAMPGLEVDADGAVYVPFVEDVHLRGLTAAGARARLQARLAAIAPDAQVQLALSQGHQSKVDLVSGVRQPGNYPLPARNYSILSLLSAGGGVSPELRNPLVRLIRGGHAFEIAATELFADATRNVTLRAGDKVVVTEDPRSFTALGASGVEDLVSFPKPTLSAMEALALIGGLKDSRADAQGILLLREVPENTAVPAGTPKGRLLFVIDLTSAEGLFAARNFPVLPGDSILVTEAPVTRTSAVLSLFGQVFGLAGQARAVD